MMNDRCKHQFQRKDWNTYRLFFEHLSTLLSSCPRNILVLYHVTILSTPKYKQKVGNFKHKIGNVLYFWINQKVIFHTHFQVNEKYLCIYMHCFCEIMNDCKSKTVYFCFAWHIICLDKKHFNKDLSFRRDKFS